MSQHPRKPPMSSNASYSQQIGQGQSRNVGTGDAQKQGRRPPMRGSLNQGGIQQQAQIPRNINNATGVSGVSGVTGNVPTTQTTVTTNVYPAQVNAAPQTMMQTTTTTQQVQAQVTQAQGSQAAQPIYLMHHPHVMLGNYPVHPVIFQPTDQTGAQPRAQRPPMKMQFMPMQGNQQGQQIFVMQQPVQQQGGQAAGGQQQGQAQQTQQGQGQGQGQGQVFGQIVNPANQVTGQLATNQETQAQQQNVSQLASGVTANEAQQQGSGQQNVESKQTAQPVTNQQGQTQLNQQGQPPQQQPRQSKPPQTSAASKVQSGVTAKGILNAVQQGSPKKPPQSPDRPKSAQKKGVRQQSAVRTQQRPPWYDFTGPDKEKPIDQGWADRVRQVVSGDTLKLAMPKQKTGKDEIATLKTIILDGIRTPKLQRWSEGDEDLFGFEARECVRNLVLNRGVYYYYCVFKQSETVPARSFGDIYVFDKDNKRISVTQHVVENGFGEVVSSKPQSMTDMEHSKLLELQKNAQENKRGRWIVGASSNKSNKKSKNKNTKDSNANNEDANGKDTNTNTNTNNSPVSKKLESKHRRELIWVQTEDRQQWAEKYLNKPLPAIVDSVISGSTLRVELMPKDSPMQHILMYVNLAGCRAPRMPPRSPLRDNTPSVKSNAGGQQSGNSSKSPTKGGNNNKGNKNKGGNNNKNISPKKNRNNNNNNNNNSNSNNNRNQNPNEEFCEFAKEWTEERLLGQNVTVTMTQIDLQKNVYAIVQHPMGKIATSLLRQGLAEYESWTAPKDKKEREELQNAQKFAQGRRERIWSKKNVSTNAKELTGIVAQIVSGDTIIVRTSNDKEERFTLSSIYAPRLGIRGRSNTNQMDDLYAREAKEFLRKMTIGKQVTVVVEYTREPTNTFTKEQNKSRGKDSNNNNNNNKDNANQGRTLPAQTFATVYVGSSNDGINVAEELVKNGLARPVPHSINQKRSCDYEKLIAAEKYAAKKKLGQHSNDKNNNNDGDDKSNNNNNNNTRRLRNPSGKTIAPPKDYSLEPISGQDKYADLMNKMVHSHKMHDARVEFIFSPNRLKLYIPEYNFFIPVTLACIRCDPFSLKRILNQQNNNNNDNDSNQKNNKRKKGSIPHSKWGERAYNYLREQLLQRDVKVKVIEVRFADANNNYNNNRNNKGNNNNNDNVPRSNTTFWGHIYFEGSNISEKLLEDGLARVMPFYSQSNVDNTLKKGKKNRNNFNNAKPIVEKGFQALEDKAKENKIGIWENLSFEEQKEEIEDLGRTGEVLNVIISHIESGTMFYVNEADSNALEEMEKAMSNLEVKEPTKIARDKYVAALYDNLYGRARIHKHDQRDNKNNMWFVMFIDYGNRASISKNQMARLPDELRPPSEKQKASNDNNNNKIPPLAIKCQLAYLRAPSKKSGNQLFKDAGNYFSELAMGDIQNPKVLTMKILYDDTRYKRWFVELFTDKEQTQSINAEMVGSGLARLSQPGVFKQLDESKDEYVINYLANMRKCKDAAVANHAGMHQFGEYDSDEEGAFFE